MRSTTLELTIAPDHPAFAGHFPGNPIVPGVVLLDRALQAICAHEHLNLSPLDIQSAKFHAPVRPGQRLFLRYHDSGRGKFVFEVAVGGSKAASGSFSAGSTGSFASTRRGHGG